MSNITNKTEDIGMKCNGCSSSTKFDEFVSPSGRITQQWHEHPDTGELVVINNWWVACGEDDYDQEFEVVAVYSRIACELAKLNVGSGINHFINL